MVQSQQGLGEEFDVGNETGSDERSASRTEQPKGWGHYVPLQESAESLHEDRLSLLAVAPNYLRPHQGSSYQPRKPQPAP